MLVEKCIVLGFFGNVMKTVDSYKPGWVRAALLDVHTVEVRLTPGSYLFFINPHLGAALIQKNVLVYSSPLTPNLDPSRSVGGSREAVLEALFCRPKVQQSWVSAAFQHRSTISWALVCLFCVIFAIPCLLAFQYHQHAASNFPAHWHRTST